MLNKIKSLIFYKTEFDSLGRIKSLKDLKHFREGKLIFSILEDQNENNKLLFVGGCVRKILNKEIINDIDIATSLSPSDLKSIFKEKKIDFIETGMSHGTITAIINKTKFEITTLRKDVSTDGRHANVEFISDFEMDAQRRDFTINAIYSNLQGEIYDPLGGVKDLEEGVVKFIGDPNKRIKEDYLRILRYFRFYTQYSKEQHSTETIRAIKKNLDGIMKISKERILDEFFKILNLKNFVDLFKDEFSCLTIRTIFPQLKYYNRLNAKNDLTHKIANRLDIPLILSILLIDNSDNCEFFLYKYKFSNQYKKRILFLLSKYKKFNFKELLNRKKLVKLAYLDSISEIIDLLIFSVFVTGETNVNIIEKHIDFLDNAKLPIFPITGDHLKSKYGFSESRELGSILKKLKQSWIDNDFVIGKSEIEKIINLD